jgi:putative SOS response-associated peptidase YedK
MVVTGHARHCLVPADAFFEWKANGKAKQPYASAMRNRHPFAFAGLWENWKDPASQEWIRAYTILTTTPNEVVAPLHDRMPLIIAARNYDEWLDQDCDPAALICPYPPEEMVTWPVSTRVNKPENDDEDILTRISLSPA